jgi:antitoxin component YwqK of YwqJK toxin-antitoxin module
MERFSFDDLELEGNNLTVGGKPFNGVAFETTPTGVLISEVTFVNGQQEGKAREFYPSGKLKVEEAYKNGSKHGECNTFFENGLKKSRAWYEYSILIESEEWDERGVTIGSFRISKDGAQYRTLELFRKAYGRDSS